MKDSKNFLFLMFEKGKQKNKYFKIEKFQRPCSWGKIQAEKLFMDLNNFVKSNGPNYYLQTITLFKFKDDDFYMVVDGQQRFINVTLMAFALRNTIINKGFTDCHWISELDKRLFADDNHSRALLKLLDKDNKFYEMIVNNSVDFNNKEVKKNNLIKLYSFYVSKLNELYPSKENLKTFYDLGLDRIHVLVEECDNYEEAQSVFIHKNADGKRMTIAELYFSKIYSVIYDDCNISLDDKMKKIDYIISFRDLLDKKFEQFLFDFVYLSLCRDSSITDVSRAFIEDIFENVNGEILFNMFQEYSELYKSVMSYNIKGKTKKFNDEVYSTLLDNKSSMLTILLEMLLDKSFFDSDDMIIKILKIINVIRIRKSIFRKTTNSNVFVRGLLSRIKNEVSSTHCDDEYINYLISFLKERKYDENFYYGDDDDFIKKIIENDIPNNIRKYILITFENNRMNESFINHMNEDRYEIEHIMPKNGNSENRQLNNIGNLTLILKEQNASIKDNSFNEKKEIYKNSRVLITQDLNNYNEWNDETIRERAECLANKALEIFSF